jgi:uncharacterized repeat protein (TIGR01451 family)
MVSLQTKDSHMKKSKLVTLATFAFCIAVSGMVEAAAAESSGTDLRWGRKRYNVPPGDYYSGRSPFLGTEATPAPAPEPAKPQPRVEPTGPCQVINSGWVHMTKTMPKEVGIGQEFMYELNPTAVACAANVVVTDQIPAGATYVRSEPKAEVVGNTLVWKLGDMDPGQSVPIKVWLRADREGELASCATVSADPRLCASTFVGKPVLAIDKSGPEMAQLGSDVAYKIRVVNQGNFVAKNVVVTDDVPEGLAHASGQKQLTFNVGDLAAGASKEIPVTLKAAQRGQFCNKATAVAENVPGKVTDDACTTVVQPGLKIAKTGPKERLINKEAAYNIKVTNTGDVPLTGVVVTDTAPAPTKILAAPGATISGNTATWNVGTLNKGEEKTFDVTLTSATPGNYCNAAKVVTAQGLQEAAQVCTDWIGVTGVLVEVVDDPDPIQVGETTTFTIRVTNQGSSRNIEQIAVKAFLPAEIDPVSASSGATISGKNVTWPVVPTLAPKQSITYTMVAKGVKAGDSRLKVDVTTTGRETPITELESTTIY